MAVNSGNLPFWPGREEPLCGPFSNFEAHLSFLCLSAGIIMLSMWFSIIIISAVAVQLMPCADWNRDGQLPRFPSSLESVQWFRWIFGNPHRN